MPDVRELPRRPWRTVSELSTMSGKALLPGFADDDDQEDQIKELETDITALFRECERRLKEMTRTKSQGSADEVSHARRPRAPPRHARHRRLPAPRPTARACLLRTCAAATHARARV